jgi:thiol-disulfide isomerase/thioredoxin
MQRRKWMNQCFKFCLAAGVLLAGCAPVVNTSSSRLMPTAEPSNPTPSEGEKYLRDLGKAPELANTIWINSDKPLRLKDLRGKVILLDMWTFECINCRNTIPSLKAWHKKYAADGLVIIANHFPEFSYEADLQNLKKAVVDLEIPYAVAQDNDGQTWQAYHNRYWPTFYLIDKDGTIRYTHIGEGQYAETEKAIQALLAERGQKE